MPELIDVVLEGIKASVDWAIGLYVDGMHSGYERLSAQLFGTPTPETTGPFVFGTPTNEPWARIYDAVVGGEVTMFALVLLVLCVQGRHLLGVFHLGSTYQTRQTRTTAWFGAVAIVLWYWVGVSVLSLVDGLTMALLPSFETQADLLTQSLVPSVLNPGLTLVFSLVGAISLVCLQALLYLRMLFLYLFIYAMPIGIALSFSNLPIISDIASRFCRQFVPMAILPLPMAVLFHGYRLVNAGGDVLPDYVLQRYVVACTLPLVALYLSWKTFRYGAPLTSRLLTTGAKGVAAVGLIGAGATVAGEGVATTAAIRGPRAAGAHAIATKAAARLDTETDESGYVPPYRRTEHDPAE